MTPAGRWALASRAVCSVRLAAGLVLCACTVAAAAQGLPAVQPATANSAQAPASAPTPAPALAADNPAAQPELPMAETARVGARGLAEWLARRVDGWFGDLPFEKGGSVTEGRATVNLFKRSDQDADVDLRFDARFRLPNVERRAYLFVGRDDQREAARDGSPARARQQQLQVARPDDASLLAGLGLLLPNDLDFRLGLSSRLKPYVRARYSQEWQLAEDHRVDLRETLFWTPDDRLGLTVVGSYVWLWSPVVTVRWVNAASVTRAADGFEWSSSLGAERSFGAQKLLGMELLVNGRALRGRDASDLGVLVRWEQPLYKNWLLGEVVAGHFWPRPETELRRGRAWAVGAGLKLYF